MAWSSAALTADEVTYAAANKPILVGIQALESPQIARWDADGDASGGGDISATGFPARWSYDRRTGKRTKPNAGAATQYLVYQLNASPDDVDCAFIQDHNFGTIGALTVTLEIADVATFTGGTFQTLATWTPGTSNNRLASLSLKHTGSVALRYSGLSYVRIKTTGGSHTPEIGEVWLGRRRQLKHKPNEPYADLANHFIGSQRLFETKSGLPAVSVRHRGRRVLDARVNPSDTTYHTAVRSWFRDTNWGTRAFVWVEDPAAAPASYNLVRLDQPDLYFPLISGTAEREFTIKALEQGPDFLDPELNP